MKRRNFLQLIAALAGLPFLPKAAAKVRPSDNPHILPDPCSIRDVKPPIPVGTILPFAGNALPAGWLPCDGRVISPIDYPELTGLTGLICSCALPDYNFGSGVPRYAGIQYLIKAKP